MVCSCLLEDELHSHVAVVKNGTMAGEGLDEDAEDQIVLPPGVSFRDLDEPLQGRCATTWHVTLNTSYC